MKGSEQGENAPVCDPIKDRLRAFSGRDEAFGAKLSEMLGQRRLAEANSVHELSNRELASFTKIAKHEQPTFVGDRFEDGHRFGSLSGKSRKVIRNNGHDAIH